MDAETVAGRIGYLGEAVAQQRRRPRAAGRHVERGKPSTLQVERGEAD